MVAMPVAPLLHTPEAVASVKVAVPPTQSELVPTIAATDGTGLTPIVFVAMAVPQDVVTV
jgi:hypothetical protein